MHHANTFPKLLDFLSNLARLSVQVAQLKYSNIWIKYCGRDGLGGHYESGVGGVVVRGLFTWFTRSVKVHSVGGFGASDIV